MMSQAQGARQAAEKYGFNPLTMLQYGQPGGSMGGGAAPLASAELLTGALSDMTDALTGDAKRRDAANQLEMDLGRLKLEQLRATGLQVQPSAVANVGQGLPPLGRRAAAVGSPYVAPSVVGMSSVGSGGIRGVGASADVVPVMVPTQGSDGITRMGPNPVGPDADQALWALGSDAYYRRTNYVANHTLGRPLRVADGNLTPPRPSTDLPDPDRKQPANRGPWRRLYDNAKWPSANFPNFSQF